MIYDQLPINDVFRRLGEKSVLGAMDLRGIRTPYFFVLHRDVLELAREVALEVRGPSSARALLPPGRGRGSSVSSIVCYFTGLSHVDPIANDLLLGRFLNEELTAFPDIDLDFPRDIREVLIPRIHERYGREHTALVATHPGFRARGAIRELGVALGAQLGEGLQQQIAVSANRGMLGEVKVYRDPFDFRKRIVKLAGLTQYLHEVDGAKRRAGST